MRFALAAVAVILLGTGIWLSSGSARSLGPSTEAGADIAARWCAACHVVNPSGAGTDAGPSFVSISETQQADELKVFLAKPHAKPMRGFTLTSREVDDVVAYISSLGTKAEH